VTAEQRRPYSNPLCRPLCAICRATRPEVPTTLTIPEFIERFIPYVVQAVRRDPLVRFCDREEVTQDVLIELFRQLRQQTPHETLLGCLNRIVRAVCANYYRRSERVARNQGRTMSEILDGLSRSADSPGEHEVDFWDHFRAVLCRLPKRMQFVVGAVWIDGCTQKEVAAALRITAPCVTRLLNRAREILAPVLCPDVEKFPENRAN
jgi:RNA polymerase sigma factor (sigma-70 family)